MNLRPLPRLAILALTFANLAPFAPGADQHAAIVNFSSARAADTKHYRFETEYQLHALDGTLTGIEKAILECRVKIDAGGKQVLECLRFDLVDRDGVSRRIPRLEGWMNTFNLGSAVVLGVPHADFINLTDEKGEPFPPHLAHRVYNTFVDFYTFNNVFAQPAPAGAGRGLADLKEMGEVIEHYSAYSAPAANLGDAVKEGSYFKNGRVTLEWLGMGGVKKQSCAIVRFDSGESTFLMLMEPVPGTPMRVKGGSRYWGDLFINHGDSWLEKATFIELVITEVVFGENPADSSVVKRMGTISLVK